MTNEIWIEFQMMVQDLIFTLFLNATALKVVYHDSRSPAGCHSWVE